MFIREQKLVLEYQNMIALPPVPAKQLYDAACSSDDITVKTWEPIWLAQMKANKLKYGNFSDMSIGQLYGANDKRPCIIAGSGPGLANNIEDLKNKKGNIPVISCLHNFHYFTDHCVDVDYYVTLDAGEVTIEEISEGGSKTHDDYLEATKNTTLLAYTGTHPKLLEAWRGRILFFAAPIPKQEVMEKVRDIEDFNTFVSNGGNVLGACLYIAKAILGSNPVAFIGADFCFSYDNKFHAWPSKYDGKLGDYINTVDVFGNRVRTWQSYYNFKCWFDYIACQVPGLFINCTESGTFGAYPQGNIASVLQIPLVRFLESYNLYEHIRNQCENPKTKERILLF